MRVSARLDLGLRPALVQQVLDLKQRRDFVRRGRRLGRAASSSLARASSQRGQPGGDPVDFLRGQPLPVPDLVDDVFGRLGQEVRVVQFGGGADASSFSAAARSFSSRRRSAATSTVPEVSSSTTTVPRLSRTSTDAVGAKSVGRLGQPRQRRHRGDLGARGRPRRRPPAGPAPSAGRPAPGRCGTGASR